MKTRMYSVYDSKTEAYTQPFFTQTDASAQRQFDDACKDKNNNIGKHPQDYTLFFIGTYDDSTAKIEPIVPISLGNGVEFLAPQQHSED